MKNGSKNQKYQKQKHPQCFHRIILKICKVFKNIEIFELPNPLSKEK